MTAVSYLREHRRFIVIERTDSCGADGVRRVTFTLAAPEIPDLELPDNTTETQPILGDDPLTEFLTDMGLPPGEGGLPGGGGSTLPSCCDDNATTVTYADPVAGWV